MKTRIFFLFGIVLFVVNSRAADTCKASCTYRDDRTGTQWLKESTTNCNAACTEAEKACVNKAEKTKDCLKIKCLSNCPGDQSSLAPSEMEILASLESQNLDLQGQVAGGCGIFWNNSSQSNETLCQSNVINGVNGALIGALVGSLGGTTASIAGGAVVGFGLFYGLSYARYGSD